MSDQPQPPPRPPNDAPPSNAEVATEHYQAMRAHSERMWAVAERARRRATVYAMAIAMVFGYCLGWLTHALGHR